MENDNLSYEPMDVDLSSHSANAMDISYTNSNVDISLVKTEESLIPTTDSKSEMKLETTNVLCNMNNYNASVNISSSKHQSVLLLTLSFLFLSIILYQIANFKCCNNLDLEIITHNLTNRLYGQTAAVKSIIKALESKENKKILLFYGGTGVGKTFTTSLILENLYNHINLYHYTMPRFIQTFSSELMLGLLFCKSAILIVDDLSRNEISNIIEPIRDLIVKSEKLSKKLTIILLFNCEIVNDDFLRKCDDSFISDLRTSLLDLNTQKYFIKFESLQEAHLRKCILNELRDRKLSVKDIDNIVKNFNVTLDGCKGVHQKLQYLKII